MTDDDLRNLFHAMREENATAHAETRRQFEETVNRISAENRETVNRISTENREYFEVAREGFTHQVELIAEKVIGVTEELRRETADIRLEMRTGFADTQAMIRFSHAELDRRVATRREAQQQIEKLTKQREDYLSKHAKGDGFDAKVKATVEKQLKR
jgi:hypothetical protein